MNLDASGSNKFAQMFEKNKVRVVKLSKFKDANDYLKAIINLENEGKDVEAQKLQEVFTREWWNAQPWTPEELVLGKNTLDLFLAENESRKHSLSLARIEQRPSWNKNIGIGSLDCWFWYW